MTHERPAESRSHKAEGRSHSTARRSHKAVIFDLDGTLTVPILDFDLIRREIGIGDGTTRVPVLEAMEGMSPQRRAAARAILACHERRAAEEASLQPDAIETVAGLRARGFAVGVLTRNARRWTELVLSRHGLVLDGIRCRDDGTPPVAVKPAPDGVLALCGQFGVTPANSWVVGDYLFDIEAGRRAGARTVLLLGQHPADPNPEYAAQADHVIRSLSELLDLVDAAGTDPPPR